MTNIDKESQEELARKEKLKALSNYVLSENYEAFKKRCEDEVLKAKATVVTAYYSQWEDGEEYKEKKEYNYRNKFAWGVAAMQEAMDCIDDSEGGKLVKELLQERIDISEEHIGCTIVKHFLDTKMPEYRYTDLDFTASDRLIYKAQVWKELPDTINGMIESLRKSSEPDLEGGTDEEPEIVQEMNDLADGIE